MRRNGPAITLASSSPATTASASASDPTSANVRSRLSCASSTGLSGSAICSVPTRRPCSAIGRVRTRIRPASSTSAVVVPSGASMTPSPLLTCASPSVFLLALDDPRLVAHRRPAGDVDDEDPRRRVIALRGDEAARCLLHRGRRREVATGAHLLPLSRLRGQVLVDAILQPAARAAVDRHEGQTERQRGDQRDRERELRAQARGQQPPSHAARAAGSPRCAPSRSGSPRRRPELAAQVADVDLQHLGPGVEVKAPDGVEDLLAREHLVGVASEVGEQLELARGELDIAAVALDPTRAQVEADITGLEHRRLALRRHAQLRAHAREQLLEGERLGHVVVGAAVEPLDLLLDRAARGQHDHRQLGLARADRVEHLQAVLAGQHHVEQDQPVVARQRFELAALTVVGDGHGVAVGLQALLDEARQRALVFDDQDAHLDAMLSAAARAEQPGKSVLDRLLPGAFRARVGGR